MNKIILFLSTTFLSACSVINTTPVSSTDKGYIENKIPYYLPSGRLKISMYTETGSTECKMKIDEVYVAEHLLFLEYNPSILSSDKNITVKLSKEGFLETINSEAEDKTPSIIAGLSKIAKMAIGIPSSTEKANFSAKECKLDITFNPFNNSDKASVLKKVQEIRPNIVDFQIEPLFKKQGKAWQQKDIDIQKVTTGVAYLSQLPYKFITVLSNDELNQSSQIVYLPNESPIFILDVNRKLFIENKINITFANGMLSQVIWNKPSEALAFINIPIEIGKAIMSIPGELLTVKVSDLNAEKGLLEAQKDYIQAQSDLIKKKAELEQK
jgi:hypothetical protein